MCDPAWDGDMYDKNTPSGKPIGSQPIWNPETKQWEWKTDE